MFVTNDGSKALILKGEILEKGENDRDSCLKSIGVVIFKHMR